MSYSFKTFYNLNCIDYNLNYTRRPLLSMILKTIDTTNKPHSYIFIVWSLVVCIFNLNNILLHTIAMTHIIISCILQVHIYFSHIKNVVLYCHIVVLINKTDMLKKDDSGDVDIGKCFLCKVLYLLTFVCGRDKCNSPH